MRRWWDDLPGVTEAGDLTPAALAGWPDRAMEGRLARLSFCPVALSELYTIAQHLPLAVVASPAGPELVADLRRDVLQRPAFDAEGRIALPYRPVAMRQLPFLVEPDGTILRLVDADAEAEPDVPRPAELQKRLVSILGAQVDGRRRMTRALQEAIRAGLVARTVPGDRTAPMTVTARAAEDRIDDCADPLALRVVAVMLYAQKNRRNAAAVVTPGLRARLSLVRDDALRERPFLSDDETIDFARLFGD
jgi:hypothetical protein